MALPILPSRHAASAADLIRFYHRCDLQWHQQIAEQTQLDVGTALVNPDLPEVSDINLMFDAALPNGAAPAAAVAEAQKHFGSNRSRIGKWVMNPSEPADKTTPLADYLVAHGHTRRALDILHLAGQPEASVREVGGLRIIPARASFKHARQIAEENAATLTPQLADATILHMEDPQTDGLLALKDDRPAAYVTVLTVGEMGCITELFVSERFRRQGVGRTMMSRALEVCARSLFKHVFVGCEATNGPAMALYHELGFTKIGDFVCYAAPRT
jgi:ribosomal protein S18 acetylase RimI-like enzyme